jgi:hypothetical protein
VQNQTSSGFCTKFSGPLALPRRGLFFGVGSSEASGHRLKSRLPLDKKVSIVTQTPQWIYRLGSFLGQHITIFEYFLILICPKYFIVNNTPDNQVCKQKEPVIWLVMCRAQLQAVE